MMKKTPPAESPDAYVASLDGWRRECVTALRETVRASAELREVVKWGHLVYLAQGPVLLIRAEESRVLQLLQPVPRQHARPGDKRRSWRRMHRLRLGNGGLVRPQRRRSGQVPGRDRVDRLVAAKLGEVDVLVGR